MLGVMIPNALNVSCLQSLDVAVALVFESR